MIVTTNKLMDSWMAKLDGVISVPVYKEGSVPEDETRNYVELIAEGESPVDTKHSFDCDTVIITDIVTRFKLAVDRSIAEAIDGEIKALIRPTPQTHGLAAQSGMQILHVDSGSANYSSEQDDGVKYYRKIVRYTHRIIQN